MYLFKLLDLEKRPDVAECVAGDRATLGLSRAVVERVTSLGGRSS